MKQALWRDTFSVTSFLVDFNKRLSLFGLLNLFQEVAWRHADHLEVGYRQTSAQGSSWVLAKQLVEIRRWPAWGDEITIESWLRPPSSVLLTRDFVVWVGQERYAQAACHWVTIDHGSRRLVSLPFPPGADYFRSDDHLAINPIRLMPTSPMSLVEQVKVRSSDLDMNGHVNNTRYAQWLLDALPLPVLKGHELTSYQVNFLAEATTGDEVELWAPAQTREELEFQGRRKDGTVLFNARLEGRPSRP